MLDSELRTPISINSDDRVGVLLRHQAINQKHRWLSKYTQFLPCRTLVTNREAKYQKARTGPKLWHTQRKNHCLLVKPFLGLLLVREELLWLEPKLNLGHSCLWSIAAVDNVPEISPQKSNNYVRRRRDSLLVGLHLQVGTLTGIVFVIPMTTAIIIMARSDKKDSRQATSLLQSSR